MFQVRLHGRGGQGVVTAAEILSVAAFREGKHSQAFPSFGSERMGAPVMAFCRIDDQPIRLREPVSAPDALVIQDPTLLSGGGADLTAGLSPEGFVLVNTAADTSLPLIAPLLARAAHVRTVPASEIARKHLGRPLPNAVLLGALAALTGALKLESIRAAIHEKFPGKVGDMNAAAAQEAFDRMSQAAALAHAR